MSIFRIDTLLVEETSYIDNGDIFTAFNCANKFDLQGKGVDIG